MVTELEELFAKDPVNLNKQELRQIVEHLRKLRTAPAPKKRATRARKVKAVPALGIKL